MSVGYLAGNLKTIADGISACCEKRLYLPALILVYSGIEITAALDNEDPTIGTQEIFRNWVKKYLLPVRMLYCNDADLYGARCGLIHTLTPYSKMSSSGRARTIAYAWGDGSAEMMQRQIE